MISPACPRYHPFKPRQGRYFVVAHGVSRGFPVGAKKTRRCAALGRGPTIREGPLTTTHTPAAGYDLFISYARKDNLPAVASAKAGPAPAPRSFSEGGWVDAFIAELVREHRRFTTVDLAIFFDKHDIRVADDWRHRILGGLRDSKIMLAFLLDRVQSAMQGGE